MARFRERPTRRAQQLRSNATDAERKLWAHLRNRQLSGYKFSRQMPVGPFICDFVCREARLVIELDGGQHAERVLEDEKRSRFIKGEGYRLIRFWNNDVMSNVDGVLAEILKALERVSSSPPPPTPPASGRGIR